MSTTQTPENIAVCREETTLYSCYSETPSGWLKSTRTMLRSNPNTRSVSRRRGRRRWFFSHCKRNTNTHSLFITIYHSCFFSVLYRTTWRMAHSGEVSVWAGNLRWFRDHRLCRKPSPVMTAHTRWSKEQIPETFYYVRYWPICFPNSAVTVKVICEFTIKISPFPKLLAWLFRVFEF